MISYHMNAKNHKNPHMNAKPKIIMKDNDYGIAFYEPDGTKIRYHKDGDCPLTFLRFLGDHFGFEVEYQGVMTQSESEEWC